MELVVRKSSDTAAGAFVSAVWEIQTPICVIYACKQRASGSAARLWKIARVVPRPGCASLTTDFLTQHKLRGAHTKTLRELRQILLDAADKWEADLDERGRARLAALPQNPQPDRYASSWVLAATSNP